MASYSTTIQYTSALGNYIYYEGDTIYFLVNTTGIASGTSIPYRLGPTGHNGISSQDIAGGALSGNAIVDSNGIAIIPVTFLNDNLTENTEYLEFDIIVNNNYASNGLSYTRWSVGVDDAPNRASTTIYSLNGPASIDEGSSASYWVSSDNVITNGGFGGVGSAVPYVITGIDPSRVYGPLSGTVYVGGGGSGMPILSFPSVRRNMQTDGPTTATISLADGAYTFNVQINDTSTEYNVRSVIAESPSYNEGDTVILTLKNYDPNAWHNYYFYGDANSEDVASSNISTDSNGKVTLSVKLKNDNINEGPEILNIGVCGFDVAASITINDTSTAYKAPIYDISVDPIITPIEIPADPINAPFGNSGKNYTFTGISNTSILGTSRVDTLTVSSNKNNVEIVKLDGKITVIYKSSLTAASLSSIERVKFSDVSVAFDLDGMAGSAVRMLGAVMGKDSLSNKGLVGIAISIYDQAKMTPTQVARLALDAVLGENPSNKDVVNLLYKNLVGINPDPLSAALYVGMINNGTYTQESITLMAANLDLNKDNINLVGLIQGGIEYVPSLF
jgi:hypothetical protein